MNNFIVPWQLFCTPSRIAYNSKRHQYTGNSLLINLYLYYEQNKDIRIRH